MYFQSRIFTHYDIAEQAMLCNIIRETSMLDAREPTLSTAELLLIYYINNQDKKCALIIEVDF